VTTATYLGTYLISGPGVDSKSSAWVKNMSLFFAYATTKKVNATFTIQMNYFENNTDATIVNLLSDSYMTKRINDVFSGS
jgi:hypothetical protein